ncbi:spermidine synthase [Salinibacter sp. 10B]|nr:spermidine synthase [Salinibacter sp. 10B]
MRRVLSNKNVVIFSVFVAGLCSLVYELLISTTASYFLGDSVQQFSITIGLYLASMGLGSYISRFIKTKLLRSFVVVEILLGLIGGLAVPLLYLAYAYGTVFWPVVVGLIMVIGALTGLEIPLLTRIMDGEESLDVNLANILSFDYLGALLATLAFPFVLLPVLGTFRASLTLGLFNLVVGLVNLWWFADRLERRSQWQGYALSAGTAVLLGGLLAASGPIMDRWSNDVYEDRVVYREQTPYQKIVMTRWQEDLRLFLNGNLQFSSLDEPRYHEPLVHVPMAQVQAPRRVLILGGGDGLAAREVLKYESVEEVVIVDLDPKMFEIARTHTALTRLNDRSLHSPRVRTVAQDAFVFLEETDRRFDVILADLPDPNNVSLARLYSRTFYGLVRTHLTGQGVFVAQSTSPYFAREAFWTIHETIGAADFPHTYPFHVNVPSFGEWGFVLAAERPLDPDAAGPSVDTRYLNAAILPGLFHFPKDLRPDTDHQPSTLDRPRVLDAYLDGWRYWN